MFFDTAVFKKFLLQFLKVLFQEYIGLMNQCNGYIAYRFGAPHPYGITIKT